jgi:hypothetical protein
MKGQFRNPNLKTSPAWRGDYTGSRDSVLPFPGRLDPTQFTDGLGVRVTTTAIAAIGATSLAVTALTGAIPDNTVLDFGGNLYARVNSAGGVAIGATAIPVDAIQNQIASGLTAVYSATGRKFIPSGTPVGRTLVERAANTPFGAAVDTDGEIFLLAFDVTDAENNPDCEFYRPGRLVKENYLPDYSTVLAPAGVASALLIKLRTIYICETGTD